MKPLRLSTDDGDYDIDPDLDPVGYKALLGRSAVHRTRLDREAADADSPPSMATQIERGRSDAAGDPRYGGYASQWAPFFESLNVLGDNTGKRVSTNVRSLDLPRSEAMTSFQSNPTDAELDRLRSRSSLGRASIDSLQRG